MAEVFAGNMSAVYGGKISVRLRVLLVRTWYHYTVSKRSLVSIVIPVYNEIDTIGACLDSIAAQTVQPHEVIVVDNNSTDGTLAVVSRYPFVKIIREERQGVVYARNTGFDAARGDIIGRIDADSVLAPNWVATLQRIFQEQQVDAVSGGVGYHHAPFSRLFDKVDYALRHYLAWALGREVALQGANMALRTSVWRASKKRMCNRGGMHEDFDLGIHVREAGFKTAFRPELFVRIAFRQAGTKWSNFVSYVLLNPGTYAQHHRARRVVMYPVVGLALVFYPILRVLYLGYDEQKDGFSVRTLLRASNEGRVNPATFVD